MEGSHSHNDTVTHNVCRDVQLTDTRIRGSVTNGDGYLPFVADRALLAAALSRRNSWITACGSSFMSAQRTYMQETHCKRFWIHPRLNEADACRKCLLIKTRIQQLRDVEESWRQRVTGWQVIRDMHDAYCSVSLRRQICGQPLV